jgi:anti-anti-sigma regulatory factor
MSFRFASASGAVVPSADAREGQGGYCVLESSTEYSIVTNERFPMTDLAAFDAPALRPEEKAALREFWRFYEPLAGAIQEELMRACEDLPEWGPIIRAMSPEQIAQQNQRAALLEDQWQPFLTDLQQQGMQYAKAGARFASWFEILAAFRDCIRRRLVELSRKDQDMDRAAKIDEAMNRYLDLTMGYIGEAYLATKEQIIREQQEAIREISTPVLQVRDQLLIIPVVGLVDTHRARLLTEGLLKAIRERRAKGVVMDITGVPIVDSKVANHLAQACEAARLMGALVVMTGISSDIALTLVTIGAELHGVRTVGDLQGGIEEVERFLAKGATATAALKSENAGVHGRQ